MNILVTGGAGFIGSCFIKYMLKKYRDYKILNLDALTYCANLENLKEVENNPNYEFIKGDICDKDLVASLIKKVDCVINFAAQTHVDNSIACPKEFIKTNINGTFNLLENSRVLGIQKYIQISTDEVYGTLNNGYFKETTPLAPNSPYSASKASADMLARAYFKTYGVPTMITRCSNNYGPNQYPEKLIPSFIIKLLNNQKVPVYGDGLNIRDWLYVKDHCRAIDIVLHSGKVGEVYNIGANNEKNNLEITKLILDAMGKDESSIEFVEDRLGHDRRYAIDSTKIQNELGWKAQVSFEEGIKETINWYLANQKWLENALSKGK